MSAPIRMTFVEAGPYLFALEQLDDLTEWEDAFVQSLIAAPTYQERLTVDQTTKLREIVAKYGVAPGALTIDEDDLWK